MSWKLVHNLYFPFISRAWNVRTAVRTDSRKYKPNLKKLTLESVKSLTMEAVFCVPVITAQTLGNPEAKPSDWRVCRFHETLIAKSISQSDNQRTELSLSGFCHTCWCNLNLYFWGELFLTLWPCHAHWALTMTDLSAAFLLWSLAQEWATGRELLCRPDRSGFLFAWEMMRLLSELCFLLLFKCQKCHLTDFTSISAQKLLRDNILLAVN